MNFSNNKVLITGGSSGLGLELSKRLLDKQNKVIICGSTKEKLLEAQKKHPELEIFQCDLSENNQCIDLANWIEKNHSDLNVLINNAAIVHVTPFLEGDNIIQKAELETQVNFLAPLRLIKYMYPILKRNSNPTIINVTTGLIYAPRVDYSFYNATKAALHSFTQVLRMQLSKTKIKVIEVMYPAVDTPWHKGNPPKIAISTSKAVNEMIRGLEKGQAEIKVGGVKILYALTRIAPRFALQKINSLNNE
ncbi:SDR family oxidoreductase [Aquimarina sediminis]|uniref:SDR family oxidoreductase n=1 Tax=Aquimarina sediminis TaxID=2070536 RepID=UPI000CA07C09|nr:SDR family NAD(P)-dependent oxidoreductase [Aquimarina sediminis]